MESLADTEETDVVDVLQCAAAALRREVDERLNAGAIAEADDATDALQSPDDGIRDQAESRYNGRTVYDLRPKTENCGLCKGFARRDMSGDVSASKCPVSRSCELSWAEQHPEHFMDKTGASQTTDLLCGGDRCTAIIRISQGDGDETVTAKVVGGACLIDVNGAAWATSGRAALNSMTPTRPEAGIEVFDGAPDSRPAEG